MNPDPVCSCQNKGQIHFVTVPAVITQECFHLDTCICLFAGPEVPIGKNCALGLEYGPNNEGRQITCLFFVYGVTLKANFCIEFQLKPFSSTLAYACVCHFGHKQRTICRICRADFSCATVNICIAKMEVGCLKHPGASTIGSQLLDEDCSHGWQILATQP